nr:hypothetical protein CFP56_66189 [Quercus suber]
MVGALVLQTTSPAVLVCRELLSRSFFNTKDSSSRCLGFDLAIFGLPSLRFGVPQLRSSHPHSRSTLLLCSD